MSAQLRFFPNRSFELCQSNRVVARGRGAFVLRSALVGFDDLFVYSVPDVVDAATLADALVDDASLRYLSIRYCGIGYDLTARLSDILHTTSIATLTLCDVAMGSRGARSLAVALRRSPRLIQLNLENSGVGDEGLVALAESLRYNTTMRYLCLVENDISDIGARSLVECLRCTGSVDTVYLHNSLLFTGTWQIRRWPEERRRGLARQRASLAVLSLCSIGDRYSEFPVVRAVGGLDWNSDGDNVAKRTLRNYLLDLEFLAAG